MLAKPDVDNLAPSIDVAHQGDLRSFLDFVALVDAYGIDPYAYVPELSPEATEGISAVYSDEEGHDIGIIGPYIDYVQCRP